MILFFFSLIFLSFALITHFRIFSFPTVSFVRPYIPVLQHPCTSTHLLDNLFDPFILVVVIIQYSMTPSNQLEKQVMEFPARHRLRKNIGN